MSSKGFPMLRPGAEIIEHDEGKLQIVFCDHTATFTSPVVVSCVKSVLQELGAGQQRRELPALVAALADSLAVDPDLADHVIQLLDASHCLYWTTSAELPSDLDLFFAAAGDPPEDMRERLGRNPVTILCSSRAAAAVMRGLEMTPVRLELIEVMPGDALDEIEERLTASCDAGAGLLAAFDIAFKGPLAAMFNRFALARNLPALYGDCRTALGQIGPYVIPGTVGCLECLNLRLLSHAAEAETLAFESLRLRRGHVAGTPAPAHPVFLEVMAGHFVCELCDILSLKPSRVLGAIIEFPLSGLAPERHGYLRAPRCPSCGGRTPPRFAWNASFASPEVKNERNEA